MSVTAAKSSRRTATRDERRQQLIQATIKCISRKGIGSTTLGDVAQEAGLSQGIVNLHFTSKDNLFNETLQFLAEDYKTQFDGTLEKSGPEAADKLLALMEMDLKPSVCDRQKLAVWFSFWGEVKAVPTYQKLCEAYDRGYDEVIIDLCQTIIDQGEYRNVNAQTATDALSSMTDGLWLSCLVSPKGFDRDVAMDAVYSYLRSVFPEHYE
ncbi:MAG TPA: TetR family transcriptional regulator C-terminal domain-containing protein [Woeseiaceae bacterium]|jgi:AcrR family transcriptional regulator|nr:TetR family transcriptional regulator C-terminal domain-containing protein [Woeseiaceae bacterium]